MGKNDTKNAAPGTTQPQVSNTANPSAEATGTPADAGMKGTQKGKHAARFSFPVEKKFTGRLQYETNGPASAQTAYGTVLRAEVIAVRSEAYANGLVENGRFAHVAVNTPLGVPEEFKVKPSELKKAAAEGTATEPTETRPSIDPPTEL